VNMDRDTGVECSFKTPTSALRFVANSTIVTSVIYQGNYLVILFSEDNHSSSSPNRNL
jgi:hypothetical protein